MRVHLLHPDHDFDRLQAEPGQAATVLEDLGAEALLSAMAGEDEYLLGMARRVLVAAPGTDPATITHRQAVLRDCLDFRGEVRALYDLCVEATDRRRRGFYGVMARHPGSILHDAVAVMGMLADALDRLRAFAERQGPGLRSAGLQALCALVREELSADYLTGLRGHLAELRFGRGQLLSARLGERCEGVGFALHRAPARRFTWQDFLDWLLRRPPRGLVVEIAPRDEAGMRALGELKDRGINETANALAQAVDHVTEFFEQLRAELAWYLAAVNLHDALARAGSPIAFPEPHPAGNGRLRFEALGDAGLVLRRGGPVVGSDLEADGRRVVVVTGANQGGKSTWLRALGLAQLMMQAGLVVSARAFSAEACAGLFTHFRREEDASMQHGKLDEELARLSALVEVLRPGALLLLNESFSATNEREGSEIARQVVTALSARGVRVAFVTHLHAFAHGLAEQGRRDAIFLRAERRPDGTRTFRIVEGRPLRTSFGEDVYREVFQDDREKARAV